MRAGIGVDATDFDLAMEASRLMPKDISNILDAGNKVIEAKAKINHRPNIDTGFLMSTIQSQKPIVIGKRGKAEVWVGAEYAVHLEYGTSKMQAYPFLRPAVFDNRMLIGRTMGNVFSAIVEGVL
jgi:HK97 gp10 family phage protein